ncbi:MAG: glutathionylspermidine synthase family protein [Armatimonadota bacterium]
MRRNQIASRPDWRQKVEQAGLVFHTEDEKQYWNESAYYEFTSAEISEIEKATNECHRMCLEAVQHVIDTKSYAQFGLNQATIDAIEWSWEAEPPTLYGRFDFVYDGNSPPKMLEYNADTPTALLEAAVIQWKWLEELYPQNDQFNSIWEGLVEHWNWLKSNHKILGSQIHFGHGDLWEDELTVAVLRDTAHEAGLATQSILMQDIGWDEQRRWFVDLQGSRMWTVFKLYPWEWMVNEQFGQNALATMKECQWVEPIWKMLLSNKALLAVLWEMFPNSQYLLESHLDGPHGMSRYAKKALLGREGSNVEIFGTTWEKREGPYGQSGYVYQDYAEVPNFDGNHPVIGSWIIGESARGIGIRETDGIITDNLARFVPHMFS